MAVKKLAIISWVPEYWCFSSVSNNQWSHLVEGGDKFYSPQQKAKKEQIIKISLRFYYEDQHKLISNFNLPNFSPAFPQTKQLACLYEILKYSEWFIQLSMIKVIAHSLSYILLAPGHNLLNGMMDRISHTYCFSFFFSFKSKLKLLNLHEIM